LYINNQYNKLNNILLHISNVKNKTKTIYSAKQKQHAGKTIGNALQKALNGEICAQHPFIYGDIGSQMCV